MNIVFFLPVALLVNTLSLSVSVFFYDNIVVGHGESGPRCISCLSGQLLQRWH